STSTTQGTCSGTATVSCNLGTIASSGSATITIAVAPTAAGTISNTASLSSTTADPNSGNNTASTSTIVGTSADLSITKTGSPNPALAGTPVTYTLMVRNDGPSPAVAVTVIDTLPAGVSFGSSSTSVGTCSGAATVTCNLGSVAAGAT